MQANTLHAHPCLVCVCAGNSRSGVCHLLQYAYAERFWIMLPSRKICQRARLHKLAFLRSLWDMGTCSFLISSMFFAACH